MGFSWAFYLTQEALREVVNRSLVNARSVTDFAKAPCLLDPAPVVMIYADNGNHMGLSREQVNDERALVDAELNRVGLATHEVVEATTLVKVLGGMVDGVGLRVYPTPERLAGLEKALAVLVGGRPVSGQDLEHVVGHLLTVMMLFRLSLSFLGHVYDFIKDSYTQKQPLWPSVRKELGLIRGILPLCSKSLASETQPTERRRRRR